MLTIQTASGFKELREIEFGIIHIENHISHWLKIGSRKGKAFKKHKSDWKSQLPFSLRTEAINTWCFLCIYCHLTMDIPSF